MFSIWPLALSEGPAPTHPGPHTAQWARQASTLHRLQAVTTEVVVQSTPAGQGGWGRITKGWVGGRQGPLLTMRRALRDVLSLTEVAENKKNAFK